MDEHKWQNNTTADALFIEYMLYDIFCYVIAIKLRSGSTGVPEEILKLRCGRSRSFIRMLQVKMMKKQKFQKNATS